MTGKQPFKTFRVKGLMSNTVYVVTDTHIFAVDKAQLRFKTLDIRPVVVPYPEKWTKGDSP